MISLQEKSDLLAREKVMGLLRKWLLYWLGILFLRLLYPDGFASINWKLFITLGVIYLGYSLYVLTVANGFLLRIFWYFFYLVELLYVSFLIFYSNGMDSLLFIFYPLVLIGIAMVASSIWDFIAWGTLGHLSYVATLLVYYTSFAFYLTPFFWVQCLSTAAVFAFGMLMVRYINGKNQSVREMAGKMKEMSSAAEQLSITDALTGLYNERYFRERLQEEAKRAERYALPLSILLLDVDFFDSYNDAYGHPAGDILFRQLAALLRQLIRDTDVVCHLKGNSFALILPNTPGVGGLTLADRLRKAVEIHPFWGMESQPGGVVSACIGVASYPVNAGDGEDLLVKAEKALAQAREEKRNTIRPHLSLIVGSRDEASV